MTFGPEYCKIQTAFKRDERGIIIPGEWTLPEFEYLADRPWRWTEKVDGTNIRLHWNGETVTVGGRTDNAQVPAPLVANLAPQLNPSLWATIFSDSSDVTVYGEGYGPKIQKGGGAYRADQGLIVFDVRVGRWWLKDEDVSNVAAALGLDVVPTVGYGWTLSGAWEIVREGALTSRWPGVTPEGLVGRPQVDLFSRNGDRIIVKLKLRDWADYWRRMEASR